MNDKITIMISKEMKNQIEQDCRLFGFLKKDGIHLNINSFINTFISTYYDQYNLSRNQLVEATKEIQIPTTYIDKILHILYFKQEKNTSFDVRLSLSANLQTRCYLESIQEGNPNYSEFFRNMFHSYSQKNVAERERILFRENVTKIKEAIQKKNQVMVFLKTGTKYTVLPYGVLESESFNYFIGIEDGKYSTTRLSHIDYVIPLNKESKAFTEEENRLFERAKKYGPQYFYSTKDEIIEIELDDYGIKNFDKFVLNRPVPYKIEGYHLYFDCSPMQVYNYLIRFGCTYKLVTPKSLKSKLQSYYRKSLNSMEGKEKQSS